MSEYPDDRKLAIKLASKGVMTLTEIARALKQGPNLVYYWLQHEGIDARETRRRYVKNYLQKLKGK